MDDFHELMGKIRNSAQELNVAKLGEVIRYNSNSLTADIQLLPSDENDVVVNVPVLSFESGNFYIYNPLEAGDLVLVVFIDNDIDNILLGQDGINSSRQHSIIDAVCIGGLTRLNTPLLATDQDNLCITQKEGGALITISPQGDITIEAQQDINIQATDNINIAGESINIVGQINRVQTDGD